MEPNLVYQGSPRPGKVALNPRKRSTPSGRGAASASRTTGQGAGLGRGDSKLQRLSEMADTAAKGKSGGSGGREIQAGLQARLTMTSGAVSRSPRGGGRAGSALSQSMLTKKARGGDILPPVPTNSAQSTPRTPGRYVVPKTATPNTFTSPMRGTRRDRLHTPLSLDTPMKDMDMGLQERQHAPPIKKSPTRSPKPDYREHKTPFDFIEYVKKNPETDKFVYLKPSRRGRDRFYSPYDLIVVEHADISQKDYYTLSSQGLTHIVDEVADFTPLDEWVREYEHYSKIKQINIFQKFRLWKGFAVWRKNVRAAKMNKCKDVLHSTLPGCNPTLRSSLLNVRGLCFEAYALRMYQIETGKTFTLDKFTENQEHRRLQSYEKLLRIHESAKDTVFEACENVLMNAEFNKKERPDDFLAEEESGGDGGVAGVGGGSGNIGMTSKTRGISSAIMSTRTGGVLSPPQRGKMSFTDMAAKRNLCGRLVNYIRLTDYLLANALQRLVVWSVEDLRKLVTSPLTPEEMEDLLVRSTAYGVNEITAEGVETGPQMRKRVKIDTVPDLLVRTGAASKQDSKSPLFEVDLIIGMAEELCFSPPAVDFYDRIDNIISDWVNTVRSIEPLIKNDVFHLFTHPMLNLRQEVIETGDGPKLGEIICNDSHYQQLLLGIRDRLGVAFDAAFRYARVFEQFKELYLENRSMDIEQLHSHAENGDIGLGDFKTMMDNFDLQHTNMDRLTEVADIGLIGVNSHQLKELILPSPTACLNEIHKLLPQLAYAKNKSLLDELNVANMELLSTPQTVKSFVEHLQYLQEINERQDELKKKFNEITAHYELMSEYHVEVPVEEKAAYQMLQPEYTKLQASIALCEAAKENNIQKFSTALSKDIVKLRQDVMEIRGQAGHPMISDAEADPTLVIEYLMALQQTASRLDEHAKNYARYQHLFKVPIEHYDDLEAVIADLNLKLQLWNSTRDWVHKSVEWTTARFDSIDPEFISSSVQRFSKIVLQVERGLPGNNVVPKLKAMVQEFKLMLPVILDLRNWALKSRHWERIEECIGRKGSLVRDETFTLGTLLDLKVMQYKDEISQISTEATQEAVLEEMVTKVKNLWEQTEFTVMPYKERKDMVVLAQVDDIVALLEDSQVTVSTVAGSRYVGPIKGDVTELENSLRLFADTLDEWLNVQRQWMYLESIFDSPDLKSQLPEEDAAFWQVNALYKDVMLRTRDNPNALRSATAPGLLQQMQESVEELDRIQKSLENWLDVKRVAFPRFYFLSNEQLLEILSHSRNPIAVQPHLRKLFDNICSLEFASTDSRTPDIIAMISAEGERIELGKNLKARGSAEEWLLDVQKEMFKAMRREMTRSFNEYTRHPRIEWIENTAAQMILATSQIYWAHDVVECFHSENPQFALAEYRDQCLDQLNDLAELVRTCDNELLRAAVVSLITMDVHSRDIIEILINDEVYTESDFGWTQRLRYYYDSEESEAIVKQSNATFNYGYEYLGNTTRLVITPLTDRCYMTCTSALHLYLGGSPSGPAGTGKTETVKDLAKALAVFAVVFNCFSPDTLIRMADGCTKRAGDVMVGDKLLGANADTRTVKKTFAGMKQLYRVKEDYDDYLQHSTPVEDGFLATGDHKLVVYIPRKETSFIRSRKQESGTEWLVSHVAIRKVLVGGKYIEVPDNSDNHSQFATEKDAENLYDQLCAEDDLEWEVTVEDYVAYMNHIENDTQAKEFAHRYFRMKRTNVPEWPVNRADGNLLMQLNNHCYPDPEKSRLADHDCGWFIGAWLGAGSCGSPMINVNAMPEGRAIRERVTELAKSIEHDVTLSDKGVYVKSMSTGDGLNVFSNILKNLGIFDSKKLSEELIEKMVSDSVSFRRGLLEGLIDTAGNLSTVEDSAGHQWLFKVKQNDVTICELCVDIARSLGLSAVHTQQRDVVDEHLVLIHAPYEVMKTITPVTPSKQVQVQDRSTTAMRNDLYRFTVEVEGADDADFAGFEVDGDHLIVLKDFTIARNCSEGIDYFFMEKFFCGLAQSGSWACLDEFNRIDIEVLSVIAQQLMTVQNALRQKQTRFMFNGNDMALVNTFGFFITMNPGYAGRTELPDNLKALFRPVSMMVPDYAMIAEIMLLSEGFENARVLSRKMVKLYKLCSEQLSQQSHYDFGMRALKSILVMAGSLKRSTPDLHEDVVLIRAMRDSNVPKFLSDDLDLFGAIVSDLFPGVDLPVQEYLDLSPAIEESMNEAGLEIVPALCEKVLQLYETMKVRFGVMLVGETAGKTTCYRMLQSAVSLLSEKNVGTFHSVKTHVLNPKCINLGELYGEFNELTHEWSDGLAASIVRTCVADGTTDRNWVVFDGPVDALWIENMNTVLDDNRTLCLANGERIKLPDSMNMLFEVQDLAVASPATVSRCGMVYLPNEGLGWKPYVKSWMKRECVDFPEIISEYMQELFDTLVDPALAYVRTNCSEDVPSVDFNLVCSLCNLLESTMVLDGVDLSLSENKEDTPYVTAQANIQAAKKILEKLFFFSITWSIGGNINVRDRVGFDDWIRHACDFVHVPPEGTCYDYFVDIANNAMKSWGAAVTEFEYDSKAPYFSIIVPTVDTMRYSFLLKTLLKKEKKVMFNGVTGVGKSVIVSHALNDLAANDNFVSLTINFSARTSSNATQEMIEAKLEKKRRTLYGAPHGKKVCIFVDDVNMPQREVYGAQPPIELLRQLVDFGGMYDRSKLFWKEINDTTMCVACAPPGGGRNPVTNRFFRHFNMISLQPPSSEILNSIFSSILKGFLGEWDASIRMLIKAMVGASVDMYNRITKELLPTPAKSHYTFNLRDLSKVFQGILRAKPLEVPDGAAMTRLWCHESLRVFHDRLINVEDRAYFKNLIVELLKKHFGLTWSTEELFEAKPLLWVDFMKSDVAPTDRVLEEVRNPGKLHEQLEYYLGEFNIERNSEVKLVFFKDAVDHLCRIVRVLAQPRGNAMLVGVGGSGRQSLTRLAAFICDMECSSIELTRHYALPDFYEDLKKLYNTAGVKGQPVVFLLTEATLKEEFFETINCILNSGEVTGLFAQDEKEKIYEQVRPYVRAAGLPESRDSIWDHFIYRTRDNLHVVLCMGSIGDSFRSRCRQFPSLVNSMQVDWYNEWPEDALLSVSRSFFEEVDMGEEVSQEVKDQIAQMCVLMHSSVSKLTVRFFEELRRRYFVTPKSYLDLIQLYLTLFHTRRNELLADHARFSNGLSKLLETNEMVAQMEKELNELQPDLQKKAVETGQLLEQLARNQKNTDQLKKVVQAEEVVVKRQAAETEALAEDARRDLAEAMPALESAIEALNSLNKNDITEIRSFTKPPILVQTVMEATCVLLQVKPDWETSKKVLTDTRFLQRLMNYDKDSIPDLVLKRLKKYIDDPTFVPDNVANVSFAARSLCMWVRAIDKYAKVAKNVRPKEARLRDAEGMLADARAKLQAKQEQLAGIEKKLAELRRQYELSQAEKASLQQRIELTSTRLDRASKLQILLGDEQIRWSEEASTIKAQLADLVGDVFLGAACVSYMGAFTGSYRKTIIKDWVEGCKSHGLPVSEPFSLIDVLGSPVEIREWNLFGLPKDNFSVENAILCNKGNRWPLLIDPEEQAKRWIINMERDNGLKRIKDTDAEYLRTLQYAISMGTPVLMEDIGEEIPAAIMPLLEKATFRRGARTLITIGDADIDYIPTFRFYMTTKLQNPVYTPEVCIRATVINMAVTETGLQNQLLAEVVRKERPDLEESKDRIVVKMAADKKALKDLEDNILSLLSSSEGSVLDNEDLIRALEDSKKTSKAIAIRVKEAEKTEAEINTARDAYLKVAIRGSGLFTVIRDLSHIDPMYQYSLQYFIRLFSTTIDSTPKANDLELRLNALNKSITFETYSNVSRGLFEQHKLIFSFLICCKLMRLKNDITDTDWNVFLGRSSGAEASDKIVIRNPASEWLSDAVWEKVCFLETELEIVQGLTSHIASNADAWRGWATGDIVKSDLPGGKLWADKLSAFHRLMLVNAIREEKTIHAIPSFVSEAIGKIFTESPPFSLEQVHSSTTASTPIIFILSTGADPTSYLLRFAEEKKYVDRLHMISLGQGQGPVASAMIESAIKSGDWVLLQNCHLAKSWMPTLEETVTNLLAVESGDVTDMYVHPDFRLFLTSMPTPFFPVPVLQNGQKITNEPPRGLRANMRRLYMDMGEERFESCTKSRPWKKLLFGLAWFHALVQERRKYGPLGWNICYEFNTSDFDVSVMVLRMFLEEHDHIPWKALKYMTGEIVYGGRVTDDWDRRLLTSLLNKAYTEDVLEDQYSFSTSGTYLSIPVNDFHTYVSYVEQLPLNDKPEVFGLDSNADIAYEMQETRKFMDTVLDTQPRQFRGSAARSEEDIVYELAGNMLENLPDLLTMDEAGDHTFERSEDGQLNSLATVLTHEMDRFNKLLIRMRETLNELMKAIRGLVVMSADLETMFHNLSANQIPQLWSDVAFPSLKPLAGFVNNLEKRVIFLRDWLRNGQPICFWMAGLFFPQGFLTGVLQNHARKYKISIDKLSFEYEVMDTQPKEYLKQPEDGVYVGGLILEGARWDVADHCLAEPRPGEMYSNMPIIYLCPKENHVPPAEHYPTPVYKTAVRAGVLSTTGHSTNFVVAVHLPPGVHSADGWTRRSAALLCELSGEEPAW